MFDGAAAVVDTVVVDDPDASTGTPDVPDAAPITRPRVTTVELTMHAFVLGQWHKQTPDLAETSCGVPIETMITLKRREVLTERAVGELPGGPLCPLCFTGHEIRRALEHDLAARKRDDDATQKWLDEAPQRAKEREQRARRNTNRGDR